MTLPTLTEALHLPWKILDLLAGTRAKKPRSEGLLRYLTPEQRDRILSYDGPVASGDQSLPKIQR